MELCWATTPVLLRAPKEAARSKQEGGPGARERALRVKGMCLWSGNKSDAALPYTGSVGN